MKLYQAILDGIVVICIVIATYYFSVFVVGTLDKIDKIIEHDTSAKVK